MVVERTPITTTQIANRILLDPWKPAPFPISFTGLIVSVLHNLALIVIKFHLVLLWFKYADYILHTLQTLEGQRLKRVFFRIPHSVSSSAKQIWVFNRYLLINYRLRKKALRTKNMHASVPELLLLCLSNSC